MIKAEELKKGNLVNFFDKKGSLHQGWVESINYNTVTILTVSNYLGSYNRFSMMQCAKTHAVKYKNINPIKISVEKLLELGFEILDTYKNESIKVIEFGINLTDCNDDEKLLINDWDFNIRIGDFSRIVECSYVLNNEYKYIHEIQNLYYELTKKSLQIIKK